MMKNNLAILFSMFFYFTSKASEYTFTCYKKINYAYINGIKNVSVEQAKDSSNFFNKIFNLNKVETIYNPTHLYGVKDLYDSFYQKVEEAGKMGSTTAKLWLLQHPWGFDHREEIFSKIKSLEKENEKLVIFSHSQGNLYANLACAKFGRDSFENIQIATPASYIGCGEPSHYTSIKQDEMIYLTGTVLRAPAALLADIRPH